MNRAGTPRRRRTDRVELELIETPKRFQKYRPMVAATATIFAAFMFGALVAYLALIDGQHELDQLRNEVQHEQRVAEQLRREESRVESPEEVQRTARDELGMVPPASAALVTPDPHSLGSTAMPPSVQVSATDASDELSSDAPGTPADTGSTEDVESDIDR